MGSHYELRLASPMAAEALQRSYSVYGTERVPPAGGAATALSRQEQTTAWAAASVALALHLSFPINHSGLADVAQFATNTSQDSLFNVPRSGFIYLPNALIAEIISFCSPAWNSHLAAGVAPFNAVTMAHGNSLTAYAFNLWPGCSLTAEAFAEHASAMYTRAIALAYGDSAILFALTILINWDDPPSKGLFWLSITS